MFGLTPQGRGKQAEQLACRHLQQQGLQLLEANYRCRLGEVDLIMSDHDTLVFVEVKYRSHSSHGHAAEFVDSKKQQRIIRSAQHYLQQHPHYADRPCRFDVVSISGTENRLQWLANAFHAA